MLLAGLRRHTLLHTIAGMMHPQSLLHRPAAPGGGLRAAALQARRAGAHLRPGPPSSGGARAPPAPRARAPGADEELDIDALISDTDAMNMLRVSWRQAAAPRRSCAGSRPGGVPRAPRQPRRNAPAAALAAGPDEGR
jgi:hypothetical protein